MCGIGGFLGLSADNNSAIMAKLLGHRGPDGFGIYEDPKNGLGLIHTRLAILDLSNAGRQPMYYGGDAGEKNGRSDRYCLIFNGEIYNYRELRANLEKDGERFESDSDTEVLLRLLFRKGVDALPMLAGMFAFAFWDPFKRRVILARDGLGIKPLYYSYDGRTLIFASEFRAVEAFLSSRTPDADSIVDFLMWGSFQEPGTLLQEVRQLRAGHYLEWLDGQVSVSQWYAPSYKRLESITNPVSQSREALLESVKRHLVSDVPVGIFLSGGIDSTAVLCLAREVLGKNADIRTFSIVFNEAEYDESATIRKSVEHFQTDHTQWSMTSEEGASEIEPYLSAMDLPTTDGFNTWCVSKLAKQNGVKVVLSGLGGDEMFAGYGTFRRVPQLRSALRKSCGIGGLLGRGLAAVTTSPRYLRLASYLKGSGTAVAAYHVMRGFFTESEARKLVEALRLEDPTPVNWNDPDVNAEEIVGYLEMTRYMRNQLLRDSDVFSMAHGLELRVPFVDTRLLDSLLSISASSRLRPGKKLLLEAIPEIPIWVRQQPKRGFRFPFQEWMSERFGSMLRDADTLSNVPFKLWYRRWAVAALLRGLNRLPGSERP